MPLSYSEREALRKKIQASLKKQELEPVPLSNRNLNVPVVSTGAVTLDATTGIGGYPRGKITEIFGPEAVGKTTLALSACIETQKAGGFAAYIDFEHAVHFGYAQKMGLSLAEDKFAFFQPDYFEQGFKVMYEIAAIADIIIVDSVSTRLPQKVYEAGPDDLNKGMGLLARLMGYELNLMAKRITETGTALIYINQMRDKIKMNPYETGPDFTTSGGNALKYYCSLRIRLKPGNAEKASITDPFSGEKEEVTVSSFVKATTYKNKLANPNRTCTFVVRYGEGIDNVRSVMQIAEKYKFLKKSGSFITYRTQGDPLYFQLQGVEKVRKFLLENPETFNTLLDQVLQKISEESTADQIKTVTEELEDNSLILVDTAKEYELALEENKARMQSMDPSSILDTPDFDMGSTDGILSNDIFDTILKIS